MRNAERPVGLSVERHTTLMLKAAFACRLRQLVQQCAQMTALVTFIHFLQLRFCFPLRQFLDIEIREVHFQTLDFLTCELTMCENLLALQKNSHSGYLQFLPSELYGTCSTANIY